MDSKTIRTIRAPMYDIKNLGKGEHALNAATINDITEFTTASAWAKLSDVQALRIVDEEGHLSDFPARVFGLDRLENLTLTLSKMTVISKKSQHELQRMPRLTQLYLPENKLKTVEGLQHIGSLTVLDLRRNDLTMLPEAIGTLTFLTNLYLAGNKLKVLPEPMGRLSNLEELDCRSNTLEALPDSIGQLKSLKFLDVGQNLLRALPDEIGTMQSLKQLQADSNRLTALPANLSGLSALRFLYLFKNRFRDVPEGLGTLGALEYLNLAHNTIQTMQPVLVAAQTLILDYNRLEVFPVAICSCHSLQVLSLQCNRLYTIPANLGDLKNLRNLYLGGNQIAELPDCIAELADLRHLTLNATKVQSLPSDFPKLRRLSLLDITDTNMDPSIHSAFMENGIEGVKKHLSQRGRAHDGAKRLSKA